MPNDNIALMAHLMRRAGFGATRDELERLSAKGYEQTVEELLDPGANGIPRLDRDMLYRYYPSLQGIAPPPEGRTHVMYHFVNSPRQLEEKMGLFWHMVFATGNSKIDNPTELVRQFELFRVHGMGSYRDLLLKVSKDPAMLFWLDNNYNHKDEPNENWGRELLELFSMGQGNYSEKDVFECARAFTGWNIAPKLPRSPNGRFLWSFEYLPEDHDDGEKEFLGQRGRFNGEDVIDIIVRQPATARFIARHLYNFFVSDDVQVPAWLHTPPRDPVAVNILADAFVNSGYQIQDTMRVLLNSDFFKEAQYTKVKSPAEVVAGVTRLVGDWAFPRPGILALGNEPGYMGQEILDPPSVEGWHTGAEWIDSGSLVRRINFAADRLSNVQMPGVQAILERIKAQGTLPPRQLVESCLDLLGPLQVDDDTRHELISLAEQGGDLRWDTKEAADAAPQRVGDMLALIASSREYQFC